MMDQSKGLSALSYLSFYFAPFILPVIIFIVTKDEAVKGHSKKAFISQLIPILLGILYMIYFFTSVLSWNNTLTVSVQDFFISSHFIGFILLVLITFILAIWNLVQAIKVLR
ncbi:hypothetical protein B857_01742 [Solibacillus isronensis B3W22]|uniref:DUF4870 domain-containing protein n=3 Tax=Caryophanaceae TaxID=186818 RepID=K1L4A1_9BACL|nr:hypothetical protein SOLI23_15715 [Solibacillus silvestris]EKB45468.1 hypothetical protein B857_01742 [Solibacillus isronensis B3W22]OUZ38865.1 hypothetical protein CBM15_10285 [Solibacillus kalamii]